jgi:hypothetical protein
MAADDPAYGDLDGPGSTLTAEEEPPGCPHPPPERRLEDGQQVCLTCGQTVEEWERQAIVPKDRPGGTDPTMREATASGLRFITVPRPRDTGRPYTPDEVEREMVLVMDRIERGAGWLTTQEEKRAAAKLAYEIAFAKARYNSDGRSSEQRNDDALLREGPVYVDERYRVLTDSEGYRELTVTDEEFAYCQSLASGEEQ